MASSRDGHMDARGTDKATTCPPHAGQHFRRKRHHHRNLDDDSLNMNEIEDRCISLHTFIPYLISLSLQQNQSETNQITLLLHHHQCNRFSIGPMASKLALTLTPHRFLNGHIQKPLVSFSSSTRVLSNGKQLCCRHRLFVLPIKAAADQQGQVEEDNVVDSKILPYCSIDKKEKKSLGEMEQEFLQALQAFYYEGKAIMSNEEFDNLKEELTWEGSSVVMLSSDEQKFLEASMAYVSGKPILNDEEFDGLKLGLKVYSDLSVDYLKMVLLNVPATVVALGLFFFLDDLTGFEITYVLELPKPFSFIFTWFAAVPLIVWLAQSLTKLVVKDSLILKGLCPNCGTENVSFFGTILSISNGGTTNTLKCSNCGTPLEYNSKTRLITLPEGTQA
ncbi:PGR5-like protein 1A, chloroplastic isoform X2 [Gossypium hirsutum]|uniref:PGR5-like protein 1A, chloroplastic isoform X2 n=1 Tax=Gossypium hirsutum TaxID=3635 RepID=A0ABM3B8J4_GOSHI|nr:PGR5-like protein 1A, chloroplastic isoform X2 [Gossypium hirsutum]XP_040963357.1 PGR5-like protein 1A, chloroplastic isoform X2 [Gossypium hirsutum]